jgi:hypothetical protein
MGIQKNMDEMFIYLFQFFDIYFKQFILTRISITNHHLSILHGHGSHVNL